MSRNGYRGPRLPKFLLDQVQNGNPKSRRETSRKDRRKAERQLKKANKHQPRLAQQDLDFDDRYDAAGESDSPPSKATSPPRTVIAAKPLKSILKPTTRDAAPETDSGEAAPDPTVSRRTKQRLQEEDAEITALEKKLGIRGKKSKALEQDGLDWIANGEDSDDDGERGTKRKRPEDAKWLRDKRLKASAMEDVESEEASDDNEDDVDSLDQDEEDVVENPFSEDEIGADDFGGFESEDDLEDQNRHPPPKKWKENPYIPPVVDNAVLAAKYIPPSLRAPASEDDEILKQLRRQIQGLLNRLSESNMYSIVQSLEELYSKNARQHVTSTLVDLLASLVADPAVLNDSFLVLHAGFAAAIYKTAGTDFGAHLLERIVEKFDGFYVSDDGKQALNLLAFLCNLYLFQVIGSAIIFDYIRMLLDELSESNTELLLRVIRTCGQSLRQNDPSALKDIVLLLQRSIAKVGEANVSVRTKFMIETINDLKNNRMKASNSSALAADQTARMKKTLTSVGKSRSFKSTEPLSITLADIRDSDKKGKWWLVGASYHDPSKLASNTVTTNKKEQDIDDEDGGYASESELNLNKLAREQGMNTEVRRAIFVSILSSVDYHHAHMQLLKLHLKNKQQLEIPRVLVHCVKAEDAYNPFYALVAMKFTGEHQKRKAFEFTLWDFFRQMDGDEEDGEEVTVRKIVNMAKFYATLVAEGGLRMTILKKLEFAPLDRNAAMFVEVFLTHVFTQASKPIGKKRLAHAAFEDATKDIFMQTAGSMDVNHGLRHVIETNVSGAGLALGKKETRAVEMGCRIAEEALEAAARAVPIAEDDSDSA